VTVEFAKSCWRAQDARDIFLTEALEGDEAIFLATHSPIENFDTAGRDAHEITEANEHAVLQALADPARRHAFCVVQGEPGSGKSHLIRWLSVNWRRKGDVKLLLRRADGSLEGALRQLKERLPSEFAPLFDNLGKAHKATLTGRANIFLSTLANTLDPRHFDPPLMDAAWCAEHAPGDLLGHTAVKHGWTAPGRILRLLEGAGGERNSATASFDLWDIQDLAKVGVGVIGTGVAPRVEDLVRRLINEAEVIEVYRERGYSADDTAVEAAGQLKRSLELLAALNRRRNDAIQNVLGVSAEGLKTLFRSVRKALQQRGERLVLLLEDITSWEGLDDSLIDVLVFNASAKGDDTDDDVCPLISVVGVTPTYYKLLQGNYKQRITHEILLGKASDGLQDVATLRDPLDRQRFVSRYLSAVRAGVPALQDWRDGLEHSPDAPPPNVCVDCTRREGCFAVFGQDDGVGLFPFTPHALDRFFEALKENDNNQTWRTPRGVLQAVLNPNLVQPALLDEGAYPGALIETTAFREDRRSDRVGYRLAKMIENSVDPSDQARMRRVIAYWADPERADTTDEGGQLALAGAPRSLFEAFNLPWIGGETATAAASTSEAAGGSAPLFSLSTESEIDADVVPPPSGGAPPGIPTPARFGVKTRPAITPPRPKRTGPTRSELEVLRDQIRSWSPGSVLENASTWNKHLWNVLQTLDTRKLGVSPWLFARMATVDMVKLQGTTTRTLNYLVVGPEPWVRAGFEAYVALGLDKSMSGGDAAFHRRSLAIMMRRLEAVAADYLDRSIPRLASGSKWSPPGVLAQILLLRAWLQGAVSADAPLHEQLRAVLSDAVEATSDPKARCNPWQEWLSSTNVQHEAMRLALREMVSLSIDGGSGSAGLTDASEIASALVRLRETGRVDEVPSTDGGLPTVLAGARKIAEASRDRLSFIDRTETGQIQNRAETLGGLLRNHGVADHLARLEGAITGVADLLPEAAPDKVAGWKTSFSRLKQRLDEGAGERLEELMMALEDPGPPAKLTSRVSWLSQTPAKDLEDVLSTAQLGEQVVDLMHDHVGDCLREASGTASLGAVKAVGKALQAAVDPASTSSEVAAR
jgi:hypothetical protein